MYYKVKDVADMVGVSTRTLHYYDEIGLFKPEAISDSGYRLYTEDDLYQLQQILFLKELDFNLQDIKKILYSPEFDRKGALKTHKKLLIEKKERLEKIIKAVDKTINSIEGGFEMDKKEMFDAFDMSEIEKYKNEYREELEEKYSKEVIQECDKRTSKYTKKDWSNIKERSDEIYKRLVSLMDKGADNPEVQQAIGEWRGYITDNFYTCTLEIFRGLGDMYVSDERFTKNIDKYGTGLAAFMRDAMHIYCDNLEE